MKIAILTQPLGYNYGGILQNWALQQILVRLGHQPITINYAPAKSFEDFVEDSISVLKYVVKHLLWHPNRHVRVLPWRRNRYLNRFIRKHVKTQSLPSPITYKKLKKGKYDAVLVGSDQVWRPMYNKTTLYEMYCAFLPSRSAIPCIAYGASFGTSTWEYTSAQTNSARQYIKNFTGISVREQSASRLCRQYLNREAQVVLDPTLLLAKEDYASLITKKKSDIGKKRNYIAVYILDNTSDKIEQVREVCAILGKKPISIGRPIDSADTRPPIAEWLEGIAESDFVITDSFHGCVFAINFETPFIVLNNTERGSDRFISLLNIFSLSDRLLNSTDSTQQLENILSANIDWNEIKTIKRRMKKDSMMYLKNALSIQKNV